MQDRITLELASKGWSVEQEKTFKLGEGYWFIVDIYAKKNSDILVVECGHVDERTKWHLKDRKIRFYQQPFLTPYLSRKHTCQP